MPWEASILAWRYSGKCQPYLATSTEATMASVGSPDLIRCSGAGASTIFSHARQASLGRCVMITRYWAGITSSRSEVSSPITCIGFLQHGQFVSAGATVS
jgi:hypothetical protein